MKLPFLNLIPLYVLRHYVILEGYQKQYAKKVESTVLVQFIVENAGSLSDIQAVGGPELLWDVAITVIKENPNWKPAVQNGKKLKSHKKQLITSRLSSG